MSCSEKITFEEQILNDIKTRIPSGICSDIPKGTELLNIKVKDITDIGDLGMTDVTYQYEYIKDGETIEVNSAMLYIFDGETYTLASLGSDCDL